MYISIKFKFVSFILVIAILLQTFPSARQVRLQAAHPASRGTSADGLLEAFDLLETAVPTSPPAAPENITAACHSLYLPFITTDNASGQTINRANNNLSAPTALVGPDITIINPGEGWTVSGMMWFAVQSIDPISSVSFMAGSTDLGTDTTPNDGFKVFLDASSFPTGTLQLSATASNACGQTTETITVNVIPHPPTSGIIGSEGGVLASEINSIITVRPDAVPDGTAITVTEKTQEEITMENGFDWDAMGVTFLGAQAISATASFSLPLGIASASFGPRVQPGQAVVNYNILPDADGDGIDELVVVNTASVAPNDDIISDPVPQIQLDSAEIQSSTGKSSVHTLANGFSGRPGTIVKISTIGFNPASLYGNVAVWTSSVDGRTIEVPGIVLLDPLNNSRQIFLAVMPPLPAGAATLILRNESTDSTTELIDVTIEKPLPLSKPAPEIFDEFLAENINYLQNVLTSAPEEDVAINEAIELFSQTRNDFAQLVNEGLTSEEEQILADIALTIENSDIFDVQASQTVPSVITAGYDADTQFSDWLGFGGGIIGILGGLAVAAGITATTPLIAVIAAGAGLGLAIVATIYFGCKLIRGGSCFGDPPSAPSLSSACLPSQSNSGSGNEGMGAAPPQGGNGCGNVSLPPLSSQANLLNTQGSFFDQEAGRVIVKVASASGSGFPFSGATDAGGYFFIPLIPQGEPFVATAIDTLTGQMRTFEGVGPPVGESIIMAFDFFSGGSGDVTELQFGEVISTSIDSPTEIDTYSFQGTAGDGIFLRMKGLGIIGDPDCCHYPAFEVYRPDGTLLCSNPPVGVNLLEEVCALDASGTYTLLYSDFGSDDIGIYQLYLQRINPPAMATEINYGQTVTGTLDFLVQLGAHTFDGTSGERILFRMSEAAVFQPLQPKFWVFRPDGTLLCEAFSTSSNADVEEICILDTGGTHSILAGGWAAQSVNPYALYLQRLNNPSQAIPTSFGDVTSGTLDIFAKVDTYRFDGTSGDQVVIRMARTATLPSSPFSFWPNIRLYRENGTELCSAFGSTLAEAVCTLDMTGPYTILASNQQGLGSYNLFTQRTNNPANSIPITYGETITDAIDSIAVQDAYNFSGTAGNQVLFRVTKLSGNLDPQFGVYRPDGSLLCSAQAVLGVAEATCMLDINGNYAILVDDKTGIFTGAYHVFIDLN